MNISNLRQWTDDHLPCVSFETNGTTIQVNWTERSLVGRLEMVEDGDIPLELALKKYPSLLTIINDPFNVQDGEGITRVDEREEDGDLCYDIDLGLVVINPKAPS